MFSLKQSMQAIAIFVRLTRVLARIERDIADDCFSDPHGSDRGIDLVARTDWTETAIVRVSWDEV